MADGVPYLVLSWEHAAFWGPNSCGYTRDIEKAGRYSKEEAEAICKGARDGWDGKWHGNWNGEPPEICFPAPEALLHGTIVGERT